MKVSLVFASLFASALAAPSFTSQYELDGGNRRGGEGGSLIERLRDDKRFSRFVEVLEKERGLRDDLDRSGSEHTVFAPTDEAFKKIEDEWRERGEGSKPEWRDIIRYHIAGDSQISEDCLHAGALVPTNLRLKTLEDRHQRIRVFRFHDNVWLNMKARIVESDIKADNGRIHAIDRVLCPPQTATEMINALPTRFSTFGLALERTGLACDLEREKGITIMAPDNSAWSNLGMENLKYLFSCAGQKEERDRESADKNRVTCQGVKDLKKILLNHVGTDLRYSTDFMQEQTTKMRTLGKQELTVCTKKRQGGGGSEENRRNRDEDEKHRDVRKYNFIINNGEARVSFTDGLASNGVLQVIDNVIVGNMRLPHERIGQ